MPCHNLVNLLIHTGHCLYMSHHMGKPTICIGENKGADQLISTFVFATQIVQLLFFLNPKFKASSQLLCLYSSHEAAHICPNTEIFSRDYDDNAY